MSATEPSKVTASGQAGVSTALPVPEPLDEDDDFDDFKEEGASFLAKQCLLFITF